MQPWGYAWGPSKKLWIKNPELSCDVYIDNRDGIFIVVASDSHLLK